MRVQIDNREQDRVKEAEKYYKDLEYKVSIEKLPIADYIFNNQVYFEYKTVEDFINSVIDHRVFNQAIDLLQTPYSFIIIVGNNKYEAINKTKYIQNMPNFSINQWIGAVSRLNTLTTVLYADSMKQAFKVMQVQTDKCLKQKAPVKKLQYKKPNPCINYLSGIVDIGVDTAETICDELGLNKLNDLLSLNEKDLLKIKGVGKKTSKKILNSI